MAKMTSQAPPMRVAPDQPQKRPLAEGEAHSYLVRLEAGEYFRVIVEQQGRDVLLRLFAPGGTQPIVEVDSPTGARGFESVSEIAEIAGDYRVDVVGGEGTPAGEYEIRIEGHRVATETDHKQVQGERVFLKGERLRRAREFGGAVTLYERALGLWQEAWDKGRVADALTRIAWMYERLDQWQEAVELYVQAASLYRQVRDETGLAVTLDRAGRLLIRLSRFEEAFSFLEEAVRLFRATSNPKGEASALANLGNLHLWNGRLSEAVEICEQLLRISRKLSDHFATRQHYWELYIDLLLAQDRLHPNQGFAAWALEAEERRRTRSLLDALVEIRAGARQRDTSLREAGLLQARAEDGETLSLKEIQKRLLDTDTLLLIYSLGEERSHLWKVTRSTLASYPLPRREPVEAAARRVYEVLSSRRPESHLQQIALDHLSDLVLEPVAADLPKYRRLLVVADGALHLVPFAALPNPGAKPVDGKRPLLIEGHPIIHLPSASVGATLRQERRGMPLHRRGPLVAIVADPVFGPPTVLETHTETSPSVQRDADGGDFARSMQDLGLSRLEPLPFSREEAKAIQTLRPEDIVSVVGFAATREALENRWWRHATILHFATHGLLNDRKPELSGLVFTQYNADGTPRQDSFLRPQDISQLDLDADLVVLSACQTGLSTELRGEGLLEMTRGFLACGVPQLVVSLWKVEDRATVELMTRFYRELFNGYPPPEALRRAQRSMLREPAWSDPALWAGFIFIGDFERRPGGDIEARDTGGTSPVQKADGAGLPPPKVKPKPPKR